MPMIKPKIFIGSSSEAIGIAKALEIHLTSYADIYIWESGFFDLSQSSLEALEGKSGRFDFAVLVLTPDDCILSREKQVSAPRDNVVFELGLFVGRIGRARTFIACDTSKIKLPSDWNGITVANFDWERAVSRKETREALSPTSTKILDAMRSAPPKIPIDYDSIHKNSYIPGPDELYNQIVGATATRDSVIILNTETNWAWKLFPTILAWRRRSVPVTLFITRASGSEKNRRQEAYRRNLLLNLGVNIIHKDELPYRAFILDSQDEDNVDILLLCDDTSGCQPYSLRYRAIEHKEATFSLVKRLIDIMPKDYSSFIPNVVPFDDGEVIKLLKSSVSQYKIDSVKITSTTVPTNELHVISKYTRLYKYNQLQYLNTIYKEGSIEPFKSFKVSLENGAFSIGTPPIVEKSDMGLVAVEGNTRATYFYKNKIDEFPCLLVEGVIDPLPSTPFPISEVKLSEQTLEPKQRMNTFEYGNFRHIERAIHPY